MSSCMEFCLIMRLVILVFFSWSIVRLISMMVCYGVVCTSLCKCLVCESWALGRCSITGLVLRVSRWVLPRCMVLWREMVVCLWSSHCAGFMLIGRTGCLILVSVSIWVGSRWREATNQCFVVSYLVLYWCICSGGILHIKIWYGEWYCMLWYWLYDCLMLYVI